MLAFPGWGENVEPGLAADADGTIYASDPGTASILALDPSGREKARYAADETGRKFENPTGLAISPKDRILYVVNSGSSSISKIRLSPASAAAAAAPTATPAARGKGEKR